MSNDIAIRVENLGKMYRIYDRPVDRLKQMLWGRWGKAYGKEFWAVRNISFSVRKGETLGLIGRNGSGKSTALQMIAGTLSPTQGSVTTHGRVTALLELGSGFNPDYTGRENIRLYGSILGFSDNEILKRASDIIAYADIGPFIDQPLKTYSSGMAVRLAFSCAVHVDPEILIIDEALSVGDARFQQKCLRTIEQLRDRTAVILVTHDISALKAFCHQAIWLDQGTIRAIGSADQIATYYLDDCHGTSRSSANPEKSVNQTQIAHLTEAIPPIPATCSTKGSQSLRIINAGFMSNDGQPTLEPPLGQETTFVLTIQGYSYEGPIIIGLTLTDRLGQEVLVINSLWAQVDGSLVAPDPKTIKTYYLRFHLPELNHGNYFVSPAVAAGSQESHEILHWVHDAVMLTIPKTFRHCLPGLLAPTFYRAGTWA